MRIATRHSMMECDAHPHPRKQACKRASMQACKRANMQTCRRANTHATAQIRTINSDRAVGPTRIAAVVPFAINNPPPDAKATRDKIK